MALPAFLNPVLPARFSAASSITSPYTCTRLTPRCASVSRPKTATKPIIFDDVDTPQPVYSPEVAAVSAAICEFMNTERVCDLANYIVKFGNKFSDLSQLSQVKMIDIDAAGFTTDIIACDEGSCVVVQERLEWPLGLCSNADDITSALEHMSIACGLPAEF